MQKRVFIDLDGVLADFNAGKTLLDEDTKRNCAGYEYRIPGFFATLPPMPGAIDAVHRLQKKYDLYILSTAPWSNSSAWSDKLLWVKKHFGDVFYKRIVLTHCKNLCKGDYLIDDNAKNGAAQFEGEWLHFGSEKYPDWESILRYLEV